MDQAHLCFCSLFHPFIPLPTLSQFLFQQQKAFEMHLQPQESTSSPSIKPEKRSLRKTLLFYYFIVLRGTTTVLRRTVLRKQACFPTYNIKNELFWNLGAEYVDRNHYLTWKQLRYWPDRKIASSIPSKKVQLEKMVGPGFKGEYIRYVEGKKKKARRTESTGHFSRPVSEENEALMFYIHGGGFCLGARWCYRRMLWSISKHMQGRTVFFLDYDLAPENPYPGALHQCLKAYLWLLHTEKVWTLLRTLRKLPSR